MHSRKYFAIASDPALAVKAGARIARIMADLALDAEGDAEPGDEETAFDDSSDIDLCNFWSEIEQVFNDLYNGTY